MSSSIKGLLIKDFKLMKSQMKFFFIIMILWGIFMASQLDVMFFIGYAAILCSFMTLSTFNYDEFENGFAYLFTLPISRKDYIFGKFLFGLLITTIPFVAMSILSWVVLVIQGIEMHFSEYLLSIMVSLPMAYLLLALEIPIQVKFGQEKSRMITIILIGEMSAGIAIMRSLIEFVGDNGTKAVGSIAGLGMGGIIVMVILVLAALLLVSYKISCRIMEKKEF